MTLSIACPPIRKSAGIDRASRVVSLYNLRRQRGERTSFDVCSGSSADIREMSAASPLYPRKRRLLNIIGMSPECHKRPSSAPSLAVSYREMYDCAAPHREGRACLAREYPRSHTMTCCALHAGAS